MTKKRKSRMIGYTRVSTDKQTLYQYIDALKEAGCDEIYSDAATSALAKDRPGLQDARRALRPGDTFVVPSIDRAFRSAIEGLLTLDEFHKDGITFLSIYQHMDTRTPEGRKRFTYDVADAEYERAVISRRTREKMAAAKRRGQHMGRPFKLSQRKVMNAYKLSLKGEHDLATLAKKYHVSPRTMERAFRRLGIGGK